MSKSDVASKILIDEDASSIFQHLRTNSFKLKIDFHLTGVQKLPLENDKK